MKIRLLYLVLLTGVFFILVPPTIADAVTYYVATSGSDLNSGMQASPFKTIQKAVDTSQAGDTILIRAGEHAGFRIKERHFQNNAWLTIQSYPGENAVVTKGGQPFPIRLSGTSYVLIENLEVDGMIDPNNPAYQCDLSTTTCQNLSLSVASNKGIQIDSELGSNAQTTTHHVTFRNLNVHNNGGTGIIGGSQASTNMEIIDCETHHNGVPDFSEGYGTYLQGSWTLRNNQAHHNNGNGFRLGNTPDGYNFVNSVVEKNIAYDNGGIFLHDSGEIRDGGAGIVVWGGSNNIIKNNIAIRNRKNGIWINGVTTQNNKIYNNTSVFNGSEGLYLEGSDASLAYNNIAFGNSTRTGGSPQVFYGTGNTQSHNLVGTDPKFVNVAADDYHLQSSSPAIDAGSSLVASLVTTDFDGVSRPQPAGGAYDIGAYEYVSASSTPTPTPTPTATQPDITTGLVGHWPFDNSATDASGSNNDATLTGSPTYTIGRVGTGALSLNGTSQYAAVADAASLDFGTAFTLSAWVNPSVAMSDFRSVLVKNYTYFLYGSVSSYCGAGSIVGGFGTSTVCQASPLPANTWTHLALTYNGSTISLYRNGNPTPVVTAAATGTPANTTGTLQIGASQYGEYFNGKLDDVRIYNRALSGADVQALYTRIPYTAPQTQTAPTIDGTLSEYTGAPAITLTNSRGTTGTYRFLYDSQHLYVGASVADASVNSIHTTRDAALYQDDSIELMLDTLHNGGTSLQIDDYKFYVNSNNAQADSQGGDSTWNSTFTSSAQTSGSGYTLEFAIPWSALGVTPTAGALVGLDLSMNDRDATGTTLQTAWMNTTGGGFGDPNGWGDLILGSQTVNAPTACHTLDNTQATPAGFAASYNPFTTQKELLLSAQCNPSTTIVTIGNGNMGSPTNWDDRMWVWSHGYQLLNNTWQPVTYTCTGEQHPISGGTWCRAEATGTLDSQSTAYLGYTCQWHGPTQSYKCGCEDTACTTPLWHLQYVQR